MIARMRKVGAWVRMVFRRRREATVRPRLNRFRGDGPLENLERREVLSSTTGAIPFATFPSTITTPGQAAQISFQLQSGTTTTNGPSTVLLGLNADPINNSRVNPLIERVEGPAGQLRSIDDTQNGMFISKINAPTGNPSAFDVDVLDLDDRVGDFVLNAFLPGDVDGDGTVAQGDLDRVRAAYGTRVGGRNYLPAADFNDDNVVGCIDLQLAKMNLGASLRIVPATSIPIAPVQVPASPVPEARVQVAVPAPEVATVPVPVSPVVVTAVPPTQVASAPIYAQPVPVNASVVYGQPVQAVPANASVVYGQPVPTVPVNAPVVYAQPVASPAVTGSGYEYNYGQAGATAPGSGIAPLYIYNAPEGQGGQVVGTNPQVVQAPVYYYGQPVVQAPVFVQPTPR